MIIGRKKPKDGAEKGVRCPACNCGMSSVVATRKAFGRIRRKRVCRHCGKVFHTREEAA